MVTQAEDPVLRDYHLELDIGRMYLDSITIGVEVTAFVEGLAVDRDTAFGIATDDLVSWHTDNALDQMTRRALGRHSDELKGLVPRSRIVNRFVLQPAARVGEDHHIATLKVGELFDNHSITYQERVLHRLRRDDEHLPDECPKQRR